MRMGISAALLLALAACGGGGSAPQASWSGFRDGFIDKLFALDPAYAVYQGKHEFDGKMPDWSEAGLKRQADFLRETIAAARKFDKSTLSADDAFERDYLVKVAEGRLFWLTDADQPHRNPAYYVSGLDPNVYIARPYADKAVRMKAMIAFFKNVPAAAANIRANLKTPLPASFVTYGVNAFKGFAEFYAGGAREAFADVKDAALQAEFKQVSGDAAKAMADIAAWIESQWPTATQDFALGAERFQRMLAATEAVDMPLPELLKLGEADLKKNQDQLRAACGQFAPGKTVPECIAKMNANKPEGGPVAEARRQLPMLRAFIERKDLVTIPGTEQALVEESPPYNRQNSAYIDPPGPFDKGIPSVYYISPPDPSWPKPVQLGFIPGKLDLLFTSVHEVFPGHFLQFLHANRVKSIVGRLFVGYAYAEGWAHYTEQMMWDAGLNDGDPETHIGQLSNALLRDCRFISAIRLHGMGGTQADMEKLFREQCFQDEGTAKQQAARGTYDPGYLNYTLGKLMILKLRQDWTATRGGDKAWKSFHDSFLGFGGPPVPLVRQAMMKEATPKPFG
ncbi:DUF885 domain-containing protein [Sphingomonas sp.]|uniref:DUF885 domain-containing protein n=1 Tax=Sphingomonas sp. TaxID=28214 RepID=UPI001D5FD692|nr:DUF885 domain-containing protein [Sphingomonas sp.]MBX9795588.1 DUF885 domain-containing protein [Sphingomonas sp.]